MNVHETLEREAGAAADIIDRAAQQVTDHGWLPDMSYPEDIGAQADLRGVAACIGGAIRAQGGLSLAESNELKTADLLDEHPATYAAEVFMARWLVANRDAQVAADCGCTIADWNDVYGRTVDEVTSAACACAAQTRKAVRRG